MAYSSDELQELLLGWLVDKRAFEKSAILAALETDQPTRLVKKRLLVYSTIRYHGAMKSICAVVSYQHLPPLVAAYKPEHGAQFEALMSTSRGSQMIMDLTLGIADTMGETNIGGVLEQIRRTTIEKEKETFEHQLKEEKRKQKQRMASMREEYDRERRRIEETAHRYGEQAREAGLEREKMASRAEGLERQRVEVDLILFKGVVATADARDKKWRRRAKHTLSAVIVGAGVLSAVVLLGLDVGSMWLTVGAGSGVVAALVAAVQISPHLLLPLEEWLFQRKLDSFCAQLTELGRHDVVREMKLDRKRRVVEFMPE